MNYGVLTAKLRGTQKNCPKNMFCEICQVVGHLIKEYPYSLKTRSMQVLFIERESSPLKPQNVSPDGYGNQQGRNHI